MKLIVPIGTIVIDDLLKDILHCFVSGFGKAVGLGVVRCTFLVNDNVVSS